VHTELALKEEELKKTKQILKEVTDEKNDLFMKVNMSFIYNFSHHNIFTIVYIIYIYF
jgi:hypothetical protein